MTNIVMPDLIRYPVFLMDSGFRRNDNYEAYCYRRNNSGVQDSSFTFCTDIDKTYGSDVLKKRAHAMGRMRETQ
jgi:hypothetical protein